MTFRVQILELEMEMEKIKVEIRNAVREGQYEGAAKLRDKKSDVRKKLYELIEQINTMFDSAVISPENYREQKELSLLLMRYYFNENIVLKEKFLLSIERLQQIKYNNIGLAQKNKELYDKLDEGIDFLKLNLIDCF